MSNETTLKHLNTALQMELTAAHQYQLHAHVLDDWGLDKLAETMRGEFQEELGHSSRFMTQILDMGGEPELAFAATPKAAANLKSMYEADLKDEKEAIAFYTKASKEAYDAGDLASKALFEEIAIDEVGHRNWLELQLSLIERLGEQRYASKFVSGGSEEEA
ncbi:bacterioferritin [Lentibacter algarum]|uniref:ferritin-like domain-containing protein n=1 Tax=Lentibacter algarum TaxID=576131 RepID=UPI001C07E769|nr:ferritin-like domain-containing protein [Lentibacter algarum]MBU2980292.1 bacterioferritin [Lentibacter algarum]